MGRNYEFRHECIVIEAPNDGDGQESLAHVCLQLGLTVDLEIKVSRSQRRNVH